MVRLGARQLQTQKSPAAGHDGVSRRPHALSVTATVRAFYHRAAAGQYRATDVDPFNPDHPVAHRAVARARLLAMGAGGVPAAFPTIRPPALLVFEPHQPEACGFAPDTFVDVTAVWERKQAAMAAVGSQRYLAELYAERNRQRAVQSRYAGSGRDVRQVRSFSA